MRVFGREKNGCPFNCSLKSHSSQKSLHDFEAKFIYSFFLFEASFKNVDMVLSQISWNKLFPHNRYDFAKVVCSNIPTPTVISVEASANK